MSKIRMLLLLSAAAVVGACSDTQSPSTPSDPGVGAPLTLQLDASAAANDEAAAERAGGAVSAVAGKGKGVHAEVVSCVHNAWHELCADIRNGVLRSAASDAIVKTAKNRTNAQLKLNGVIIAKSGKFGPNFVGDEVFANYNSLGFRVFRGDKLCSQFVGVTPQVCATIR